MLTTNVFVFLNSTKWSDDGLVDKNAQEVEGSFRASLKFEIYMPISFNTLR